jgi:hypothetical protein
MAFVLLLNLVYHCSNNTADTCGLSLHLVHCTIEIIEVPLFKFVINTYHRSCLNFSLNSWGGAWTLPFGLLRTCGSRSSCFYWLLKFILVTRCGQCGSCFSFCLCLCLLLCFPLGVVFVFDCLDFSGC